MHKALSVLPLLLLITACRVTVTPSGGNVELTVGEEQVFTVSRSDCRWILDGDEVARGGTYTFRAAAPGEHALTVRHTGSSLSRSWRVLVTQEQLVFTLLTPDEDPAPAAGEACTFRVAASIPASFDWSLDGIPVTRGDTFTYTPLITDAGTHQVEVQAGAGGQTATHRWTVEVDGASPAEPPIYADHMARTPQELIEALKQAAAGEVILVPAGTTLDLNGHSMLKIPGGVTLSGGEGAVIRRTDTPAMPLLVTAGDDVRLTGLTFQGPGPETGLARAVSLLHEAEVDLCTFTGWSYTAVYINAPQKRPLIHHNNFRDCRKPYGYGVEIKQGDPLITHNIFDGCRHAVAGQGKSGCSYEAAYNLVLSGVDTNHVFDMHGDLEHMDPLRLYTSRYQAGSRILIHHNTVTWDGGPAVGIRGKPRETAHIHNNRFRHTDINKAVRQTHRTGNLEVYDNELGYFEE